MEVFFGIDPVPPQMNHPVVTLGAFDGIHLGHQKLLRRVNEIADELDGTGVLLTFEPHPQRVIAPGTAPPLLTSREEKLSLLEATGLQTVVILPFNRELSEMEAEDFVVEVLAGILRVQFLVLGHDHAFGRGRRGRPDLLRKMAPELGFDLEVVEAVTDNGTPITSSLIRRHLLDGSVEEAGSLLGRPYSIKGHVVRGEQRGKGLGYPTANLALPFQEKCVPGDGIYAVRARVRAGVYTGACSIGTRPTFGPGLRTIEAYLMDFEDDIYGESVEVDFHARVREQFAFEGIEALKEQIEKDVAAVRRLFSQEGN